MPFWLEPFAFPAFPPVLTTPDALVIAESVRLTLVPEYTAPPQALPPAAAVEPPPPELALTVLLVNVDPVITTSALDETAPPVASRPPPPVGEVRPDAADPAPATAELEASVESTIVAPALFTPPPAELPPAPPVT